MRVYKIAQCMSRRIFRGPLASAVLFFAVPRQSSERAYASARLKTKKCPHYLLSLSISTTQTQWGTLLANPNTSKVIGP